MDLETLIVSTTCHRICKTDTNFWTCSSSRVTFVHFGWTVFGMEQNRFHSEAQVPVQVVCLTFIVQNFPLRGAKTKKIIVLQEIRERSSKSVFVQATCLRKKI